MQDDRSVDIEKLSTFVIAECRISQDSDLFSLAIMEHVKQIASVLVKANFQNTESLVDDYLQNNLSSTGLVPSRLHQLGRGFAQVSSLIIYHILTDYNVRGAFLSYQILKTESQTMKQTKELMPLELF